MEQDQKAKEEHNTAQYWNNVYGNEIAKGIDQRSDPLAYDLVASFIKDNEKVLDFACGRCDFLLHLMNVRENIEACGVDQAPIALEDGFKKNNKLKLWTDVSIFPKEYFDIITMINTVEHFKDPATIINALRPYLKKGGKMIFDFPIEDMDWVEHYQVWKLQDVICFLEKFNAKYKLIYRDEVVIPAGWRGYKEHTRLYHPNDKPVQEVFVVLQFDEIVSLTININNTPAEDNSRATVTGIPAEKAHIKTGESMQETSKLDYDKEFNLGIIPQVKFPAHLLDRDFLPTDIYLEVTNYCNAKCVMCPNGNLRRPKGVMEEKLFKWIINQCVDIEQNGIDFFLHHNGEPLLDPILTQRVSYIKAKMKKSRIALSTNGAALYPENAERLINSGLQFMTISLDAANPKTYQKIRGMNYERTINNVNHFLHMKKQMKSELHVTIQMVVNEDNQNEIEQFKTQWKGEDVVIKPMHNFLEMNTSLLTKKFEDKQRTICLQPFLYMIVNWNGDLAQCCWDADNQGELGNLRDTPLVEAFNSPKMKEIRKKMIEYQAKGISLCNKCSQIYGNDINASIYDKRLRVKKL
jgi:2-polyprenyl-3-methyl-5-hydroxy-6-metoxy-1,4-benzoquinol methylase/pyruvate-formate lyase-activating enzyme